jgi:hypothetical protein
MPPETEPPFDSAACGGELVGIAATSFGDDPALGLSVQNELYGLFGVIIPATNYRLRAGDYITVDRGAVRWRPQLCDWALLEFQALRIVKVGQTP